jgi:hypothetical protein
MNKETKSPYKHILFSELQHQKHIYPSEAQKKNGQYLKYRFDLSFLLPTPIDIENLRGQTRKGIDSYGNTWKTKMIDHYGYFVDTYGNDGDEVDVFINYDATESEIIERPIFTIKQVETTGEDVGKYDEDKVVLGAKDSNHAKRIYLRNYSLGWQGVGAVKEVKDINHFLETSACRTF